MDIQIDHLQPKPPPNPSTSTLFPTPTMQRPSTTPPAPPTGALLSPRRPPLTPEQILRIETGRLKAKAIREQREAEWRAQQAKTPASGPAAGFVRQSAKPVIDAPANLRDGRNDASTGEKRRRPDDDVQAAKKFAKFVEYDFSKMTDTKGGFMTAEDDPHNKALSVLSTEDKPAGMTMNEWQRQQLLKSLRDRKEGPYRPGISANPEERKVCRDCGGLEIDRKWDDVFKCRVCNACKEKYPDKYSLLTKTEAREDYMLTDPELKDAKLLPHLEKPNPHKSTFHNMMLYLRFQVEEYAFSERKWGSPEALDEEFTRREAEKKKRKDAKFKSKLQELKKRTRVEAHRRSRQAGGGEGNFGDDLGGKRKHLHEWGRAVDNPETGMEVKTCIGCGIEVEELEF
ncbi:MAG: hypothetical protein M1814_005870 [Vezdaea aestivalis]|nr:MAG: hypothetical protein M1814_005870 [Vezdaea aestivalis]